jgi:hypothetical protein
MPMHVYGTQKKSKKAGKSIPGRYLGKGVVASLGELDVEEEGAEVAGVVEVEGV